VRERTGPKADGISGFGEAVLRQNSGRPSASPCPPWSSSVLPSAPIRSPGPSRRR